MLGSGQEGSFCYWNRRFSPTFWTSTWDFVRQGCGHVLVRVQADSASNEIGYFSHTYDPEVAGNWGWEGALLCEADQGSLCFVASATPGMLSLSVCSSAPRFILREWGKKEWVTMRFLFCRGGGEIATSLFPHPIGQHLVTLGDSGSRVQTLELDSWGSHPSSATWSS